MIKKYERTEILDDGFLDDLEQEINKKYPHNTKDKIELLDDTIEILNNKLEELKEKTKTLDDTIEFLKSDIYYLNTLKDENIEILEEEIENFTPPSENIENTIELLDIQKRDKPINVKKKITPKKKPWIIFLSICIIVIIILSYKTIIWKKDCLRTNQQIENIIEKTTIKNKITTNNIPNASTTENTKKFEYLDVDFTDLKKQNQDVKGWIKVQNSNINYPFVQTTNNEFYLKHSFDKSYNSAGWVFVDYRNNLEEWDQNTILYAHGRLDNTMFGSLKKVIEQEWYENKENQYLQISSETSNTIWQVISVYTIEPETYYITPNFKTDSDYETFLNTIQKRSIYNFNQTLTTKDKIITLSSCYNDKLRVVLHAKLINTLKKEDEESK